MDYERPIPLAGDVLKQRIFSPVAYGGVRRAHIVAIAASEAGRYAAHFPIAWRKVENAYQLVILRSLLADGRGHIPGTQKALAFFPILLRAYPFMFDPAQVPPIAGRAKFVDTAMADEPADIGAPICLIDGRPTKATTQRLALLDSAAGAFGQTMAISQHLAAADLFETWPLRFDNVEGLDIDINGLWIVKQDAFATGAFAPLMRAHGLLAADLIGLHRASLFRAGILLAQSRAVLKAAAAAQQLPEPASNPATADALAVAGPEAGVEAVAEAGVEAGVQAGVQA